MNIHVKTLPQCGERGRRNSAMIENAHRSEVHANVNQQWAANNEMEIYFNLCHIFISGLLLFYQGAYFMVSLAFSTN